jgi:hypothetical protein
MHPQENSSSAPQPLRMSLNASSDQLQKLADSLHHDTDKRRTFESDPNSILQEFGLELHNPGEWINAPAFGDHSATLYAGDGEIAPVEIAIACVAAAQTVSFGIVVCVAAVATPPPDEEEIPDPNSPKQV